MNVPIVGVHLEVWVECRIIYKNKFVSVAMVTALGHNVTEQLSRVFEQDFTLNIRSRSNCASERRIEELIPWCGRLFQIMLEVVVKVSATCRNCLYQLQNKHTSATTWL